MTKSQALLYLNRLIEPAPDMQKLAREGRSYSVRDDIQKQYDRPEQSVLRLCQHVISNLPEDADVFTPEDS